MTQNIHTRFRTQPLSDFFTLHRRRLLNLNPGFQRQSVWSEKDRIKLILSILDGYPVPSIFLYRRKDHLGRTVFDVLDGKQRLEAVFAFARLRGFGKQGFSVPYQFKGVPNADDRIYPWRWRNLKEWNRTKIIANYKVQVVEVKGELPEIQNLFVLINSTGKKLSSQEKRKAKFISSPILAAAEKLARNLENRLESDRIISRAQRLRMKDVELLCELIVSFYQDRPINKKAAVDKALSGESDNQHSINKAVRDIKFCYKVLRKILPDVWATRFRNISDFYSLMLVLHHFQNDGMNLEDRKGQRIAQTLLKRLASEANKVQEERRKLHGVKKVKDTVRDYLMAVEQGADAISQRNKRQEILLKCLENVFNPFDRQRTFTRQQRELVWNEMKTLYCPGWPTGRHCVRKLTWKNFQIDHIRPWSHGGKTDLENARGLCGPCNKRKGAKVS